MIEFIQGGTKNEVMKRRKNGEQKRKERQGKREIKGGGEGLERKETNISEQKYHLKPRLK